MEYSHKGWRRGTELNRRIKLLQSSALPLGYLAAIEMCAFPKKARGVCTEKIGIWQVDLHNLCIFIAKKDVSPVF